MHGVHYDLADKPKTDLYREMLPLLNAGRVEFLDHPKLDCAALFTLSVGLLAAVAIASIILAARTTTLRTALPARLFLRRVVAAG